MNKVIDWRTVLDEIYQQEAGLSEDDLKTFVSSVTRPLSESEVRELQAKQVNPFRASDPLHKLWKPFDIAAWTLPQRELPQRYLEFLRFANGAECRTGERAFGFFSALGDVRAMILAYEFPEYMPGTLPFALNGGGVFYIFDMREPAVQGEYPVLCAHAGNLGLEPDCFVKVADSFLEICQGRINVEELL
jgi:hypothetical protein